VADLEQAVAEARDELRTEVRGWLAETLTREIMELADRYATLRELRARREEVAACGCPGHKLAGEKCVRCRRLDALDEEIEAVTR
jgi:sulfopyruvate decarboxylase TPP-binding subunit